MKQSELIDIGVNLTNSVFQADLAAVLTRADEQGVDRMIVTGTDLAESEAAAKLAADYPDRLWSTAGIHPHDAKTADDNSMAVIRRLAALPQVVAIGECGLDYNRDYSPRPTQDAVFEQQLALAAELQMPVFMHERDANARFIEILKPWRDKLPAAVLHCFTGSEADLKACLDLDLHIGMTGWICDERRGQHLLELVSMIPGERLMLETDSPYLLPRDLRPKPKSRRNEPAHLRHIAHAVAAARKEPVEQLIAQCRITTEAFFNL